MKFPFMKYIVQMWKRIFDYKGKSTRKEYWIPFAFNAVLTLIMVLCLLLKEFLMLFFMAFPAIVIAAYLCFSFVPFISLTVRRLHDAGKSGKWYLLSFILGAGAVIVIIMCAGKADAFDPYSNFAVSVYGPPPDYEDNYDPSENLNADVYGPPEYFETTVSEENSQDGYPDDFAPYIPEENISVAVYGPPQFEDNPPAESEETAISTEETAEEPEVLYETTIAESAVSEETLYDPEENINEDVYGPPEYFDPPDDSEEIDLPVPEDAFEPFFPEDNAPICVYGPPEFFQ
ncbi:MAG: DUF805 domain-containing protein [Oscillospiraceae bacterium]|nr:DUF805 domain-containing protein [Oscillospiraceae bacterium]